MALNLHSAAKLEDLVVRIFTAAGWSASEAGETARHLVLANLSGHDSHGVSMVPIYINSFINGHMSPKSVPEIRVDAAPFLVIDGKVSLGQPTANAATRRAIGMAKTGGVCILNLLNTHHIGRIGNYAEMAAEAGLISMFWVNVAGRPPIVAPFGARESRLGTNPHTIGVPCGETPLILDFATSRMAHGKARMAHNKGEQVPPGYLIDKDGVPTTDPQSVFDDGTGGPMGSLLSFGDYKGAGIGLMAEILSAGLAGGPTMPETPRKGWVINNLMGILIDPARLDPSGTGGEARTEVLANYIRSAQPQAGIDKVRAPGDIERETRIVRQRDGIAVDAGTWKLIVEAAEKVGVAVGK